MVWESEAWPSISSKAGSETKKKRGNSKRFFSKYLFGSMLKKHKVTYILKGTLKQAANSKTLK